VNNIALEIRKQIAQHPDAVALRGRRGREWEETGYRELDAKVEAVARSLVRMGVEVGERVAIFAPNSPSWALADLAILSIRAATVTIFATSTADTARYILEDASVRVAFAGARREYAMLAALRDEGAGPEIIVAMDGAGEDLADARDLHFDVLLTGPDHDDAEAGAVTASRAADADPEDVATVIYTSGTTGEPKGVMLAHGNFRNQIDTLETRFSVTTGDRSLCFLPLSHVFERSWSLYLYMKGATNSFVSDPGRVMKYLGDVRPNVMASAPRLYEKVYSALADKLEKSSVVRRGLFRWALHTGGAFQTRRLKGRVNPLLGLSHRLADKLVLSKIREALGGPKKFMAAGGAPLAAEIEQLFFSVGLLICQGYGLTETAPMLTCNSPDDFRFGTVGKPVEDVELRIDEEGEILARGPNVMQGYLGKPEETREAMRGGWFHTGDVGHFDDDGFLVITDRIKDLIVTSGGKNVAPQRLETMIGKDPFIDQLAVFGDQRKFVSALVVPTYEALSEWAQARKLVFASHEELVKLPEVVRFMQQRIREQSQHLAPFEKVKRFTLLARQFTIQAGEITPTLKVKRRVIMEKYAGLIEQMYSGQGVTSA